MFLFNYLVLTYSRFYQPYFIHSTQFHLLEYVSLLQVNICRLVQ